MISLAFIDVLGLTYDDTTVERFGLGGSESAIIYAARELTKIGISVTVFNNCNDSRAQPGTYNGVRYVNLDSDEHLGTKWEFDVVIVSRSVRPFFEPRFKGMLDRAKHKILWMHDTFCEGDNVLEELLVSNVIDEVFTLSDFHTSYFTSCNHGRRRNFEVLKRKIFMTRNGICRRVDEVNVDEKDPHLFVYNASATKGMVPLLNDIWPRVKERIPLSRLKVVGGYYRFRDGAEPDAQEKTVQELSDRTDLLNMGVEFTGIITQKEIAELLAKASYTIYPGAFPETFGISTLESLAYKTPVITTRFGALEETAVDLASYLIDYAIEPNSLFTDINKEAQVNRFVDMVVGAFYNPYLKQQKMHYCEIVREVEGWDTVMLQWKQHLYKKLGLYLPAAEYRKVKKINDAVHRIYKRRFSNEEEWGFTRTSPEKFITIVSPFYNGKQYLEKCILSVAAQDYKKYEMVLIDDASTDGSYEEAERVINSLPDDIRSNFMLIRNDKNIGAVANQVCTIRSIYRANSIVMLLDGDDSLVNDNTIFQYYNTLYHDGAEFTYGSCWSMADNIPLIAQPYPKWVKEDGAYRDYKFNWGMPYTHLRTFKHTLLSNIDDSEFKDADGNWFRAGGDNSLFYALIEKATPDGVIAVPHVVYNYNDLNPLNDYKVNSDEQTKTAKKITERNMPKVIKPKQVSPPTSEIHKPVKRILIGIPTAKYIESECFKSIYDLDVPEGYETTFQFFFGYNVDQVRNLIAQWALDFDYLFSVDSDIILPKDALAKLLSHDKDVVCGIYLQRIHGVENVEVYGHNGMGGIGRIPLGAIAAPDLYEIAACGMGCTLVKSEVFRKIGYPQFVYHSALDHRQTYSEDVDFCEKARKVGYRIWVDSSVRCDHTGAYTFKISEEVSIKHRLKFLGEQRLLPEAHAEYLKKMDVAPKVIYDLGACVLHWTNRAVEAWPDAKYFAFEGMREAEFLYQEKGIPYHIAVMSDEVGKPVDFHYNPNHPGGNSYYPEGNTSLFKVEKRYTDTLDNVVAERGFPLPSLIKMDIQGAELDVLKGAEKCLAHADNLILELQHTEYNKGAPLKDEVIKYLKKKGFKLVSNFVKTSVDGDYHFVKK
jgi:FkbM family methyltransferase